MRNDWVLTRDETRSTRDRVKHFIQRHEYIFDMEVPVHTGTWDECVALGKLVGCTYWWNGDGLGDKGFRPIEEPPDER
jgi:hypothetical protein